MLSKLFIHHHLGLGDHFDCNGMVRYIGKNTAYEKIAVFSKSNYFSMIEYMYRDNDDIEVWEISKDNEYEDVKKIIETEKPEHMLTVGHQYYPGPAAEKELNKNCWEFFYEQVNIPYNVRHEYFYLERDPKEEERVFNKLNPNNEPYIFVHEDVDRGFELDRKHFIDRSLHIVENDISENVFHFLKIIEEAEEIHCMESSFKTLIDIYAKQDKIFYHDFRNQPLGQNSLDTWKVIKYD